MNEGGGAAATVSRTAAGAAVYCALLMIIAAGRFFCSAGLQPFITKIAIIRYIRVLTSAYCTCGDGMVRITVFYLCRDTSHTIVCRI